MPNGKAADEAKRRLRRRYPAQVAICRFRTFSLNSIPKPKEKGSGAFLGTEISNIDVRIMRKDRSRSRSRPPSIRATLV